MRQLQFVEKGKLEWRDAPEPELEADSEAVVRPVALATCDIDVAFVQGRFPAQSFPFGHECVAEVTKVGDSVSSVKPGDLVSVPFQISCGKCAACRDGRTGNCESVARLSTYGLPIGDDYGGFASDAVRVPYPDAMLVPIPEGVSPSTVASLSDNIPDAWRCVAPPLAERPGSPVLIAEREVGSDARMLDGRAEELGLRACRSSARRDSGRETGEQERGQPAGRRGEHGPRVARAVSTQKQRAPR